MSAEYKGQDINKLAEQAEKDLNSYAMKTGHDNNPSARHGKGASVSSMFPRYASPLTYSDERKLTAPSQLRSLV